MVASKTHKLVFNSEMNQPTLELVGWYITIYKALSLGHFLKRLLLSWLELDKAGKKQQQQKNATRELNWNIWRCLWWNTRSISMLCAYIVLDPSWCFLNLWCVFLKSISHTKTIILGSWFQSLVLSIILKFCFSLFSVIFTQK